MQTTTEAKLPNFFTVIFFAIAGFTLSFLLLNNNYKDYGQLPKQVTICPQANNCVTLNIKQSYQLPDTAALASPVKNINKSGNILFHYNPSFLIWTMLILLLMTVSWGALPVFIKYIRSLKDNFSIKPKTMIRIIAITIVSAAIMVVLPLTLHGYYTPYNIINDMGILFKHSVIILGISLTSIILSLPMIVTMFLVGAAADKIKASGTGTKAKGMVDQFNYLNSVLLAALQVLAIIVVLSGFCSAALGESIKSSFTIIGFDIFPKELSYAYGLFYALFLAIFYLPVYFSLKERGKALQKEILLSAEGLDEKAAQEQKALGEHVELKSSALDSLKLALTILSPLIASFLPEQLQIFK